MNAQEFAEQLKEHISFLGEVLQRDVDTASLKLECASLSQIIAALVLEHGGNISSKNWDRVRGDLSKFIPHGISQRKEGVCIKVHHDDEATA